jgi:hypothetical protein
MSITLEKRLSDLGCDHIKRDELEDALAEARHALCPDWTAETILIGPEHRGGSVALCNEVRRRLAVPKKKLPNSVILGHMLNVRKRPREAAS